MARNPSTELAALGAQSFEDVGRWEEDITRSVNWGLRAARKWGRTGSRGPHCGSAISQHHEHYAGFGYACISNCLGVLRTWLRIRLAPYQNPLRGERAQSRQPV